MVDMTLIRPLNKGQGHSFWTWYESIPHNSMTVIQLRGIDSYYDFLYAQAVNSNFCSSTHAPFTHNTYDYDTIQMTMTAAATTDRRNTVAYARPLVRRLKMK